MPSLPKSLTIPSALIHASGMAALSSAEQRLFFRLVDMIGAGKTEIDPGQIVLRLPARDLWEDGEKDSHRLCSRLAALKGLDITGDLDGRDGNDLWRLSMALVCEWEIRGEGCEIQVGWRLYRAILDRSTFAAIRTQAMFSMRKSKYAAMLYALICDKQKQRIKLFEVSVNDFRRDMKATAPAYTRFEALNRMVIKPAIVDVNEHSEFICKVEKSLTHKNKVKMLEISWEVKAPEDAAKVASDLKSGHSSDSKAKAKAAGDGAPPLVPDSPAKPDPRTERVRAAVQMIDGLMSAPQTDGLARLIHAVGTATGQPWDRSQITAPLGGVLFAGLVVNHNLDLIPLSVLPLPPELPAPEPMPASRTQAQHLVPSRPAPQMEPVDQWDDGPAPEPEQLDLEVVIAAAPVPAEQPDPWAAERLVLAAQDAAGIPRTISAPAPAEPIKRGRGRPRKQQPATSEV